MLQITESYGWNTSTSNENAEYEKASHRLRELESVINRFYSQNTHHYFQRRDKFGGNVSRRVPPQLRLCCDCSAAEISAESGSISCRDCSAVRTAAELESAAVSCDCPIVRRYFTGRIRKARGRGRAEDKPREIEGWSKIFQTEYGTQRVWNSIQ